MSVPDGTRGTADGLTVLAPAKLNLSLAVLTRRPDGFHEIESLMVPVSLADTLRVRPRSAPGVSLRVSYAGDLARGPGAVLARDVPADESNLVARAATLLAAEAGVTTGLDVELVKRIPSGAGLGGGSSDAAAVIRAAAATWQLDWPVERLVALGARIGSDVPWFFAGSAAIASGRGERVEPVPKLPDLAAVIACPADGLSTAAVYSRCVPDAGRRGDAARLAAALAAGDLRTAEFLMVNALEPPARSLSSQIDRLLAALADAGGWAPRLTGSGSACFTLARTIAEAETIAARLSARCEAEDSPCAAVFAVRCSLP
ncbi:MAG: 4-(cytidine 5'-diphospho)-2-C-methyl-D-erythritol kinase [Planctomycetaceae bacterium]